MLDDDFEPVGHRRRGTHSLRLAAATCVVGVTILVGGFLLGNGLPLEWRVAVLLSGGILMIVGAKPLLIAGFTRASARSDHVRAPTWLVLLALLVLLLFAWFLRSIVDPASP